MTPKEVYDILYRLTLIKKAERWTKEEIAALKHGEYLYADYAHERAQEIQALLDDMEG